MLPDGFGYPYQAAVAIGSIVYGSLGFALAAFSARLFFARLPVALAVILLWLASNTFYYMVFEPSMPHMVSLLSVALVLTIWLRWFHRQPPPVWWKAVLLGASGSLVLLVRMQDAPFLLIPAVSILVAMVQSWRNGETGETIRWVHICLIGSITALIVCIPQFLTWRAIYGSWLSMPYVGGEPAQRFIWLQPQLFHVLFSSFHGLFIWHPVFLLATIGLFALGRRDRWLAVALLIVFAIDIYSISAWSYWWQGDSFGGRKFITMTWAWVLGLAALLAWLWSQRRARPLVLLVGVLLILWNALSLMQYRLGFVPMGEPLTWEQMTIDRLLLPWTLLQQLLS
ncbi:MAG: hypothetical protein HC837_05690 [Chloroflexaceae bacterium]|nr:hypothetical protein [Chloroflexaceae bacterium]